MKTGKKFMALGLALVLCLAAVGCGGNGDGAGGDAAKDPMKDAKEYSNEGGNYSVKVPSEFSVTAGGNADSLTLDNADRSLTIMIQRFPAAETDMAMGESGVDKFVEFYHKNAIASLLSMAENEPTLEDLEVEGMTAAKAEEIVATQGGTTAKAYVVMMQSENAYYSFVITGVEDAYDKNIDTLKLTIPTFTEK